MKIIDTSLTTPAEVTDPMHKEWVYNAFDCMLTAEILDELLPQLDAETAPTYAFSKALQGPVLEMRLRGVLVDQQRKAEVLDEFHEKLDILERNLDRLVLEGCGLSHFNWRSPADLQRLFYDRLRLPAIKKRGRITTDRAALEKLEAYLIARPIVAHMFLMRDLAKQMSVLKTEIDPDGRIRTSYNIAGTSTFRFSSSLSEFGTGGNLQNVQESLRSMFVADPGCKWAKFDAKQIQSRIVGAQEWNVLGDGRYLDACESSDLHTEVAKLVWPDLGWKGDIAYDLPLAEQKFYRHYDYRFMCKKIGHGTNFGGKPPTIAAQTKIPLHLINSFQPKYFQAFPAHLKLHHWTANELRRAGSITSITGRKRHFWGRRTEDSTLRDALAFTPQADESVIVNSAMLNIWRRGTATVMMQDHDALVFQYPEHLENEIIPQLKAQLLHPVPLKNNRTLTIPYDCQTGWNRGKYDAKKNPDGLKDWAGGDERKRQPKVGILDRISG